eukprot:2495165-Rhodomonas_salina.4
MGSEDMGSEGMGSEGSGEGVEPVAEEARGLICAPSSPRLSHKHTHTHLFQQPHRGSHVLGSPTRI